MWRKSQKYCGRSCNKKAWAHAHPELMAQAQARYESSRPPRVRPEYLKGGEKYDAQRVNQKKWQENNREKHIARCRRFRQMHPQIRLAGERVLIQKLPDDWQPLALLIRQARKEIRAKETSHHG